MRCWSAPRSARRRSGDDLVVVPLADVRIGDVLVAGPGEVVPVDGRVLTGPAMLDESALTGESALVERGTGEAVGSGVVNAGGAVDVEATATAEDSTYAQQVVAAPGRTPSEVLRLAASLDQMSAHVLAEAIVAEARARGLALPPAREVTEEPGRGVTGTVDERRVTVGKTVMPPEARPGWARAADNRAALDGAVAWLTVDGASGP
ncbi:hypothetical protein [Microbispora triticiradicis]|uniref:P-type ATPase n=1 Tax=Microbispora triticiradicis TaxID=2200763 RepID=UPI001AD7FFE9|nr:hypothetical protein [Microbispora triticiradicis]GLW22560.1 hypothetical protein Mame01_26030 [Microbispora amethystogenes]